MPYLLIEDFKFGMDRRRNRVSGTPGTMWTGKNVHITRGGDIQRTKKFDTRFALPAGSHGLATMGEQLFVFDDTNLAGTMPPGVNFQQLIAPSTPAMTRILAAKAFNGLIYAIAEYDDGNIYHFYDAARVTSWDAESIAIAGTDYNVTTQWLASKIAESSAVEAEAFGETILITASVPGTDFTISKSTVNPTGTADEDITLTTEQANVAAVAETLATGTIQVTGGSTGGANVVADVTVDSVSLFAAPVAWVSSHAATASAIATEVNNNSATHGYTAIAVTDTVTLTAAAGTGATVNGDVVAEVIPGTSNVTVTTGNIASGVTAVAAVAKIVTALLSGTFDADDQFTVTIDSVNYTTTPQAAGTGKSLYVYRARVYSTVSSLVKYCQINDPTDWTTTTTTADAGFLAVANDSDGAETLTGMADYNNLTAIFSQANIYIYALSANNSLNSLVTVLRNTGTRAGLSITPYGNRDVFYLDASGIRSIQARDSSGDASVDDVGTVIDPFVQDFLATIDESQLPQAQAAVEPKDNLYMLLLGGRIYILSRYPKVKISAWTYMEPDLTLTDLARTPKRLYARDTDTIYLYGGSDGEQYDDAATALPLVELPFVAAKDEAGIKMFTGFDIACLGEWDVDLLVDPNHEDQSIDVGVFKQITYGRPHAKLPGLASHVAFKLTGRNAGKSVLSSLAIHFEKFERQ